MYKAGNHAVAINYATSALKIFQGIGDVSASEVDSQLPAWGIREHMATYRIAMSNVGDVGLGEGYLQRDIYCARTPVGNVGTLCSIFLISHMGGRLALNVIKLRGTA